MNELETNAELAALLFEESGLNASLTFLFKSIKKTYPITRIFINFRSSFDFSTIPIANVFNENHQYIDTRSVGDSTEPFTSTKNIVLIEDISVDTLVSSYMSKLDNMHRSLLSIPFFKTGNYFFCIGIAADVEQDFPKDKVDYFVKLFSPLAKSVEKNFRSNPKDIKEQIIQTNTSLEYIKQYKGFKSVWEHINKVAPTNSTVLITGETGSGKEMVADAIHALSQVSNGPFVKVNCGAIPESLMISELFGHERGSFTGAINSGQGYFEKAHNGTIFLDEIGELSLNAQVYLLRVLERKEIQRIGSAGQKRINVRIIAATHQDLSKMVDIGTFRKDLWYRLIAYPISVPPLRRRRIDIIPLVYSMLESKSTELNLPRIPNVKEEELSRLYAYDWPGNVRQLSLIVEKALITARTGDIVKPLSFEIPEEKIAYPSEIAEAWQGISSLQLPSLKKLEREYIEHILSRTNGKIEGSDGAATILDLKPSTLRSLMQRLKIKNIQTTKSHS